MGERSNYWMRKSSFCNHHIAAEIADVKFKKVFAKLLIDKTKTIARLLYNLFQILESPMKKIMLSLVSFFAVTIGANAAETVIPLSSRYALLNSPSGIPRAGLVLITGGDGYLGIQQNGSLRSEKNWIVWTRRMYAKTGVASLLIDQGTSANEAVEALKARGVKNVYIVGMSRGCLRAMDGLSSGIAGIVLVSCHMDQIQSRFRSLDRIPRKTLVIHHRQDRCRGTAPYKAEEFAQWAGNRARIKWMTGGVDAGDPCQADGHHGHKGIEGEVVSQIVRFVRN